MNSKLVRFVLICSGLIVLCLGKGDDNADGVLDCYVCSSRNNSNSACTDPFNPHYSKLSVACRQGMSGRYGLFPARFCIKMKGISSIDGTETIVRYCALETLDNMCGQFKYDGVLYTGCITSCQKRACNGSSYIKLDATIWLMLYVYLLHVSYRMYIG